MARLVNEGWNAASMHCCSFLFCERGSERVCISIECVEPGRPRDWIRHFFGREAPNKWLSAPLISASGRRPVSNVVCVLQRIAVRVMLARIPQNLYVEKGLV